jgi:hypothetical protein
LTPGQYSWIGVSSGIRGLNLNYVVTQDECGAELYIDRGKDAEQENKAIFDQLSESREAIDQEIVKMVGRTPSWERLDSRRASRIRISVQGGYRSPEHEWDGIQEEAIKAMNAIDQVLKPYLKKLKVSA